MIKVYGKENIIYSEGGAATEIYRIASGTIRCTRIFNKNPIEVGVLGPKAFIGLISVMRGCHHVETAVGIEKTELEVYRKPDFEMMIKHHPEIGLEVLTNLSAQIRELNNQIKKENPGEEEKPVPTAKKLYDIGEYFFKSERCAPAAYVFSRYVELYPQGDYIDAARDRLNQIRDTLEINLPVNEATPELLEKSVTAESAGWSSRIYETGAVILSEHEPGMEMFFIEFGKVKVITIEEESEKVLAILGPGEFFGEMAVLDREPRSATIIAAEPTKVAVLTDNNFGQIVKESPDFVIKLIQQSCKRLSAYAINYPHLFERHRYN
jgi:CRP-like cAMP-binding protein